MEVVRSNPNKINFTKGYMDDDASFRRSYYAKAIILPDSVKKGYVDNLPKDELKAVCRLTAALDKCRQAGMSPHSVYKVIFEKMMFDYDC